MSASHPTLRDLVAVSDLKPRSVQLLRDVGFLPTERGGNGTGDHVVYTQAAVKRAIFASQLQEIGVPLRQVPHLWRLADFSCGVGWDLHTEGVAVSGKWAPKVRRWLALH